MSSALCPICSRPSISHGYCRFHEIASDKIKQGYLSWKTAYGDLQWERYLETISKLEDTGRWVLEVALFELQSKKD